MVRDMPTNIIITRTKAQRAEFQRLIATAKAPTNNEAIVTPTLITEEIVVPSPKKRMGRPPKIKTNI